ncbi:Isochorismate synthase MenF [Emticicia aquatica]|uniref:Isochorismate synthase MenF n=1 Tax=Emticicia aquatica TaxID=1681835 RepID=A0ABN8ETN1_9BACT|nr:aminodeoxychorismate synthase component I [Emticicia aquatica]CAH0995291.1 Isochorismate synthase MenF [Emticicia aquatica]
MKYLNQEKAISTINLLGREKKAFLFLSDFKGHNSIVEPLDYIDSQQIKFLMNGKGNISTVLKSVDRKIYLTKKPIDFSDYAIAFRYVQHNILQGNSFLTNLTCETDIELNVSLLEIFEQSEAKYKIWIKGDTFSKEFVCFSPEIFVKIDSKGKISSFPMKGTIDAEIDNAEKILLNDAKEFYEHTTIVDLIRNDLSKVASKVWVEKFRYLDRIKKEDGKDLLQVSSQVSGLLADDWRNNLGKIIFEMLPAGSISGAPKNKTLEIIAEAEKSTYNSERGFYTGICGFFDGETFDSGVMIRFIEKTKNGLVFKSGGGITAKSICTKEYQEMIQKIYVPVI